MTNPRVFNKTFNPGPEGTRSYNACVGNNGFVDRRSYGDGFAEAVDLLTSALLTDDHRGQLDTLIYPICFCARHHVELFVKEQLDAISKMRGIMPLASTDNGHHLGDLWKALVTLAAATDRRLGPFLEEMDGTISDIAQIDPTGQTFRYPISTESVKHLVQTPVINIPTLRREFLALAERIDTFEHFVDALADEYRRKTFTTKLSRPELETIAKSLPKRDAWGEGTKLTEIQARFMEEFGLSKKDFCRALCAIQEHREFCALIGMHLPIAGLDTPSLDALNQLFKKEIQAEQMPPDSLVALSAVFELASPSHYSEDFDRLRDNFALDFDINECVFLHVPRWARQIERLATGLRKVGQLDLADYLERNVKPAPQEKNTGKASDVFSRLRIKIDRQEDDPK